MATAIVPYVTVDEYLHTVYEPDVDFVDGILEDRNVGEFDHGDLQLEIGAFLRNHSQRWNVRVVTETRVQVLPMRFRIPDICVMTGTWQKTQIIREAPLLCIEILSPEDRVSRVLIRCREFLAMGTTEVWVFDPAGRTARVVTSEGVAEHKTGTLRLHGTEIALDITAIFSVLDR